MPIPDDLKEAYPDDWEAIREAVLERAASREQTEYGGEMPSVAPEKPCCEWCGKPDRSWVGVGEDGQWCEAGWVSNPIWRDSRGVLLHLDEVEGSPREPARGKRRIVLTCAHLCQDPRCDNLDHLRALCQHCHLQLDRQPEQRELRKKIQAEIRGQQTIGPPAGCESVVGEVAS